MFKKKPFLLSLVFVSMFLGLSFAHDYESPAEIEVSYGLARITLVNGVNPSYDKLNNFDSSPSVNKIVAATMRLPGAMKAFKRFRYNRETETLYIALSSRSRPTDEIKEFGQIEPISNCPNNTTYKVTGPGKNRRGIRNRVSLLTAAWTWSRHGVSAATAPLLQKPRFENREETDESFIKYVFVDVSINKQHVLAMVP